MSENYETLFEELRLEVSERGARPESVDNILKTLFSSGVKILPGNLLALLSDDDQLTEGMFSIVHAAESVDDAAYVQALILVFPTLKSSAPRWASIVLMRVLNNEESRKELVRQIRNASAPEKKAVADICNHIRGVNSDFLMKTIPVILAAS